MKDLFELWNKHGNKLVVFLIAAYFYQVTEKQQLKIEQIEAKLYDCYEDKAHINNAQTNEVVDHEQILAVLPERLKIVNA